LDGPKFQKTKDKLKAFVNQIAAYTSKKDAKATESLRAQKKKQYELDLKRGKANKFDWYQQLPGYV